MCRLRLCEGILAATLLLSITPAFAQQSTTATYGDWIVRCNKDTEKPPRNICDMEQLTTVKGKETPLSRVAIARPVRGHPIKFVVQVPVNVTLAGGVKLLLGDKGPTISGRFDRCLPSGCFAEIDVGEKDVRAFRAAPKLGKIVFQNAAGHEVALPLSPKGFGDAFDALIKD